MDNVSTVNKNDYTVSQFLPYSDHKCGKKNGTQCRDYVKDVLVKKTVLLRSKNCSSTFTNFKLINSCIISMVENKEKKEKKFGIILIHSG